MKKWLNGWKSRYLSKGGRLTLIKASLVSIPIHFLCILVLLKSIGTVLEQIQRDWYYVGTNPKRFSLKERG